MSRGRFITLEGGDGAGKSTQGKLLAAYLESKGQRVLLTREVGGAPGAEDIRALWLSKPEGFWDPMTEAMLVMAARREHLAKTIWPALESGIWVISDRFVDSTRAYQGIGLGLGVEKIDALYREIAGDFWPDKTLLLDLPVAVGHARMIARAGAQDRYEQKNAVFHEKLRAAFLQLAEENPQRFAVIDASAEAAQVADALQKAVVKLLDAGE